MPGRARRRLEDLERRWSRFLPESEISQLNRSSGRPLIVSAETFDVVSAAIGAWRWSEGRFDPTTATTMDAAGYGRSSHDGANEAEEPAAHLACATPARLVLDPYPRSITAPAGVSIDLGGIGKGAAADLVAAELLQWGAEGCCVNVGGDLRVTGRAPRPEGWLVDIDIDIDTASGPGRAVDRPVVGLLEGAVCTSTSTRRRWTGPLGPEHHLRDPRDGRSLLTGLATVTVIGAEALRAEVLAKTAFAAGPQDGAELIVASGATGILLEDDGTITELDGLAPFLAAAQSRGRAVA